MLSTNLKKLYLGKCLILMSLNFIKITDISKLFCSLQIFNIHTDNLKIKYVYKTLYTFSTNIKQKNSFTVNYSKFIV